tara:strand:+ start:2464 stop:2682 length:219 start_codon:yes stop_codon:yes gene_type:complete
MSKTGAFYLEKQIELADLYAKIEEAVMAIEAAAEMPGFHQLKKEHKETDFYLLKTEAEDFLSIVDDYVRGDK